MMADTASSASGGATVVTGAAGFIGSCLVGFLNEQGLQDLILVDDFSREDKKRNLESKKYRATIEREVFFDWLKEHPTPIDFFFHIGARTDTTEFDYAVHQHLNVDYSQKVWQYCSSHRIPLVYASSAATYGNGEFGYEDDHALIGQLQPLNAYGISKNEFDKWALEQSTALGNSPPSWAGLKFFNVYGPNEYHKARMASVIFHSFNQLNQDGLVRLFRSHRPDFQDGQQLRDFIYVKDVIKVCFWMMISMTRGGHWTRERQWSPSENGIYNVGTGTARSFEDLVKATFAGLDLPSHIQYIDMPADIREKYQYYTQAAMGKLIAAGYSQGFYSLEDGVDDYVRNYLTGQEYY